MHEEFIKPYFQFLCDPLANSRAMVQGDKYRFTILTSRLIRLEYSETGHFEDRPTQTVWFRNLDVPKFSVEKTGSVVKIETEHLLLKFNTSKRFNRFSLGIQLKLLQKNWHFGDKGRGNLKGTTRTLDGTTGFAFLHQGLMSKKGYTVLDDSKSLVFNDKSWLIDGGNRKDYYFFGYGRDYVSCLKDFYLITGKTPMIPRFILGNWWSRYWAYNETELKTLISTFKQYAIPLSTCIIDMDWHLVKIDPKYGKGWTGYTWNKALFPDPQGMLEWLHAQGLNVALNLHPASGIQGHEACYPAVADFMGVDKAREEPVKFDIADPKFASAYFDLVLHPLEDQGVDFWWIDWQQGKKTTMSRLDPLWMLNHLHFFDLGRDGTKRPFIFSRWGGHGNHRYPIGFSGDTFVAWRSLAFQPYFTVTASNIGYGWWSHDIGGHMSGKENAELYTRWVQFGIFSPIMRLHSTKNQFIKREPWKYDFTTLKIVGDAMRLRHRLIPYIYSMAYQNYANFLPLMRPLYYSEPNENYAYQFKNEYWFGSEILVAPTTKKRNKKSMRVLQEIFLPPNQKGFFNYFTKEFCEGNQIITRIFDLCDIPVFANAGAIIPLDEGPVRNITINPENISVDIFPGDSNTFLLYEDEGNSESYKQNDHYITRMEWSWGEEEATFTLTQPPARPAYIPSTRRFTLIFNAINVDVPPEITSDNGVKCSFEIQAKANTVSINILQATFTNLKVTLYKPVIWKYYNLREQAHKMLMDANLPSFRKVRLAKQYLSNRIFGEKESITLYRKCS